MHTRLVLIRHAHTAGNSSSAGRLMGRTDLPLSARGEAELERLRERLRDDAPFAAIYASPLQRAWRTAAALADVGLGEVRICEGLQEIDCGLLDGRPLDEVKRGHPDLWAANLRQDDDDFRWPGGESYRVFRLRCLRAVRAIARAHRGERVALVTHAGVVSQVVGVLRGVGAARWEEHRPRNTALTEIDWAWGAGTVVAFDDHAHLGPLAIS